MRKPIALLSISAVASAAGLGLLAASTGAASTVNVGDNYFVKPSGVPTVSAQAGNRITFRYVGRKAHQVSTKSGPVKFSAPRRSSGSYKSPALKAGTYLIFCKIHGQSDQSMKLKVS